MKDNGNAGRFRSQRGCFVPDNQIHDVGQVLRFMFKGSGKNDLVRRCFDLLPPQGCRILTCAEILSETVDYERKEKNNGSTDFHQSSGNVPAGSELHFRQTVSDKQQNVLLPVFHFPL